MNASFDLDRFYRTLAHSAPDAVIYVDANGLIRVWNSAAERVFGFSESEALGQSLDIIIPPNLRARHWNGYAEALRTGTTRYGAGELLAVPALRKDGARISVEFTILPIRGDNGDVVGVAAILRDVTKRFQELKALRKRLVQLDTCMTAVQPHTTCAVPSAFFADPAHAGRAVPPAARHCRAPLMPSWPGGSPGSRLEGFVADLASFAERGLRATATRGSWLKRVVQSRHSGPLPRTSQSDSVFRFKPVPRAVPRSTHRART